MCVRACANRMEHTGIETFQIRQDRTFRNISPCSVMNFETLKTPCNEQLPSNYYKRHSRGKTTSKTQTRFINQSDFNNIKRGKEIFTKM